MFNQEKQLSSDLIRIVFATRPIRRFDLRRFCPGEYGAGQGETRMHDTN